MNSQISLHGLRQMSSRTQFHVKLDFTYTFYNKYVNNFKAFFIHKTIIKHLSTADTETFSRPFAHCAFCACHGKTPVRKTVQRMSDKCIGGGTIWPHAVFSPVVSKKTLFVNNMAAVNKQYIFQFILFKWAVPVFKQNICFVLTHCNDTAT